MMDCAQVLATGVFWMLTGECMQGTVLLTWSAIQAAYVLLVK